MSEIFKISSICDTFALTPHNRLRHLSTRTCVVPDELSSNSKLKLTSNCDDINSVFQQTATLQLRHVNSGFCVYQLGAIPNPPLGTDIIINDKCDSEVKKVFQMDSGKCTSKFWGVSGSEDRGGGDNSIQFINFERVGDNRFKE